MHDKSVAEATPYGLPPGSELLEDLGFLGLSLDGVHHTRPHKKPKGNSLTVQQKEHNRAISRRRIVIEHIISSIKRCRIVKDTIRLYNNELRDLVMEICCGLHNFRV